MFLALLIAIMCAYEDLKTPLENCEAERDSPKVNVWCGLMWTTRRDSATCLFAPDRAPPHWSTILRSSLNDHFLGRWIGQGGPFLGHPDHLI